MTHTPRRLPLRVWCGAFPRFVLPCANDDSTIATSSTFFGSDAFAHVRTQLALKLQETPSSATRRTAAHYTALVDLANQYKTFVVALLRYVHAKAEIPSVAYTPLFVGWGDTDLHTERLVGREHRLLYAMPVDVVLTFVLLGQLHAHYAETIVDQGLALESEPIVAAAEASWRTSTREFTRAASVASATLDAWRGGDPQLASLAKFLTNVSTQSIVLARLAQMQRAATRIASAILLDETVERMARHAAVCARYAHAVASEARVVSDVLDNSRLSRQLVWLVHAYAIRWKALFYSYEQTIFQLDAQFEIAIFFGELVHRGERVPPLPEAEPRTDAGFTRLAHELQQIHTGHLSDLLTQKATLLSLCQHQRGPVWSFSSFSSLPRELLEGLQAIPAFEALFTDEDDMSEWNDSALNASETLTVDVIHQHVQCARAREHEETQSVAALSMRAVDDTSTENEKDTTKFLASSNEPTRLQAAEATKSSRDVIALASRPSSAGSTPNQFITRLSTSSNEWVTMRVGDKVLHFEPLPSPSVSSRPPRPLTAGTIGVRRRNALPMDDDDLAVSPPRKPRPSSSQSYLSSAAKRSSEGTNRTRELAWVPTRAPCALCERRFVRANLPGVVVMKRIFELRRKWGMVLQDSKKFSAASALYGKASVCVMCHDILTFEDDQDARNNPRGPFEVPLDDVGGIILARIRHNHLQQPPSSDELLLDVAVDKRARQSSTNFGLAAHNAVQAEPLRTAHTKDEFQPWWEVDLGNYYVVHSVKIWLREDNVHNSNHGHPHRKMGIDVPSSAIPLHSIGFGTEATARGVIDASPLPHPNAELYPLHLCVSMKTGVDRDFDDVIASAVSTHCVAEKIVQPITWTTPPNCRGRFVRLQSEGIAFLHIEKVQVFVAQELPIHAARQKQEKARKTLKRVAFRASVISKKLSIDDQKTPTNTHPSPQGFASAFVNPELAEKRRLSRLYLKFKSLLDARSKYVADERLDE